MNKPSLMSRIKQWLPALIVMLIALGIANYLLNNKPITQPKPSHKQIPLVQTIVTPVIQHTNTIQALGTVKAAKQINLTSRISGMVTKVSPNFIPGSFLKKGDMIVQLEKVDYRLALAQAQNKFDQAEFQLTLEQGQQAIAAREFKLLNANLDVQSQALVLRKPHLKIAQSNLLAAKANLKQAQLNLQRTKTTSPFNAIVLSTNAHIGSWVSTFSTGTPLIQLAGTDHFWVLATLPVKFIQQLNLPSNPQVKGSPVKIYDTAAWGDKVYRTAYIKRLKVDLETVGRMAEVIIEIEDPLSLQAKNQHLPRILLGSFVNLEIQGATLNNLIAFPESLLHKQNTLWLLTAENKLAIQSVTPLWKEKGQAFIDADSLPKHMQIISSHLNTPVMGMSLRTSSSSH